MKIAKYFNKLHESKEFKNFQNKHKDSYFCAGFFVLDFENGKNMHQLDYYHPKSKKVTTFMLDKGIEEKISEQLMKKKPLKLDTKTKIDLDALKGIVEDEMKNHTITEKIKKIIAILQVIDGKKIWNLNCITSGMGLLKVHVDDETDTILKFEKVDLMDIIRKV